MKLKVNDKQDLQALIAVFCRDNNYSVNVSYKPYRQVSDGSFTIYVYYVEILEEENESSTNR